MSAPDLKAKIAAAVEAYGEAEFDLGWDRRVSSRMAAPSTNRDSIKSALLALVSELSTAPDWQPISTAPKNNTDILIASVMGIVRIGFFDLARGGVWSIWPGREKAHPTHWRPLPAPPTPETAHD